MTKSNFVKFVESYAPTEATEGQKANHTAVLNSTTVSVPAREDVFTLTKANARTAMRGEGSGKGDGNVLSTYGRDVLNQNGKLLRGFADNKVALLDTVFYTL